LTIYKKPKPKNMKKNLTKTCVVALISFFISVTINAQYTPGGGYPGTTSPNNLNNQSQPNGATGMTQIFSGTGKYTLSADGAGKSSTIATTLTIRVNKPTAAATVYKAFFLSTSTGGPISPGCVTLQGSPVTWAGSLDYPWALASFYNYWADVTSLVAPVINGFGAGISTLTIGECPTTGYYGGQDALDGEALLVIFNDATATEKTILVMWGGLSPSGDSYSFLLGQPIDPAAPGAVLDNGLGIGFSYQANGSPQFSTIDVNSQRLTSAAGGEDDGASADGALITVGGIGDLNTNPSNPNAAPTNARSDDELYSLLPFITNTTTNLVVNTSNPSNNDNIFLSYFVISGSAIIINGPSIVLSQTTTSGCKGSSHTVNTTVVDGQNVPIPGVTVNFNVTAGPNNGTNGSAVSNINGQASFTYASNGVVGTDLIQACFTPPTGGVPVCSNNLNFEWLDCNTNVVPTLSEWGLIILGLFLVGIGTMFIIRRTA
jgi:hypothetical protein